MVKRVLSFILITALLLMTLPAYAQNTNILEIFPSDGSTVYKHPQYFTVNPGGASEIVFELDGKYPYRGLRGDDIPDDLRVVTCNEVMDYIEANSGDKKFNYIIEIKSLGENGMRAADKLYSIITERNLKDRVIWATSEIDVSEYMSKTYPDMPRSANPDEVLDFFLYCKLGKDLAELNVTYVALHIPYGTSAGFNAVNLGTKKMINYAHKYNIAVQYWTVNNEYYVKKLAENGADCVMTDYPDMAYKAIEEVKKEHSR